MQADWIIGKGPVCLLILGSKAVTSHRGDWQFLAMEQTFWSCLVAMLDEKDGKQSE